MDDSASFGYWVRRRRKALDLTQDALARRVGCSVMTIRKIEGDVRRPSRQLAELLAERLQVAAHERAAFIGAARAELRVDRLPQPAPDTGALDAEAADGAASEAVAPLPSGTATFLFIDLPASLALWERDRAAAEPALARYHALARRAVEAHDGVVFKVIGDLVCAAFARAPRAVEAALAAQRALGATEGGGAGQLPARLALHAGSVELHDGEYVGLPLGRVARLLEVGHGGQALLSLAAYELVRDYLPPGAALHDLGTHRLRDLTRPEHLFQLGAPGLPADFPAIRTLDQHHTNLPLQPTALIGREREVAAVRQRLARADTRLLTLTGPGGTGKTRLALQAAAELLDAFADGVYLVALAPIRDPALVVQAIAATLGVKEGGDTRLLDLLKRHVRDKQMLLVLDNFEQVLGAAPLVAELLDAAPRLKLLVTSRACLQVYGEGEYPVPPLALPNPGRLPPLERLTQYEAVRLFIERARAAKPDFAVSDENAPAVAEICVRLDGLPLAIELAAVRVKVLSPQALLARLARRLQVLTGGARNLPQRQQTLRDAIAWSHELLPEAEQRLFARLAVFGGGCTLETLEAVCNAGDAVAPSALDGVQALVNNSLVRLEAGAPEPRLSMLETIREYALEQLAASGEEAQLRARHAAHFLALAVAASPRLESSEQQVWLERLEAEHDNLRAALTWALDRSEWNLAAQLGAGLWHFWEMRGYFTEGRRWLAAALENGQELVTATRAEAYTGAGTMAWRQCDYAQATAWHQRALELYRALGDTHGVAFALNNIGSQLLDQGSFDDAVAFFKQSLELSQRFAHLRLSAMTLHNIGEAARHQGDYAQSRDLYLQSLAIFRTLGDLWAIAYTLVYLGYVAVYQGDDTQATAFYQEALAVCRQQPSPETLAACFEGLGGASALQGQAMRAARLFGAAERLREAVDAPRAPMEQQWYGKVTALAGEALGPAALEAARGEGRAMVIEEAIAYAMQGASSSRGV